MKLLGNRLLLQLDNSPKKLSSGLYTPEKSSEENNIGKIIDMSSDVSGYRIGDTVKFNKGAGKFYTFLEQDQTIIFVHDVIAKIG